jgi:hypothetical protein
MKDALSVALLTLTSSAAAALPHLDLFVSLDTVSRELQAQALLTGVGDDKLDFTLAPGFEVLAADIEGRPVEVRWQQRSTSGPRFQVTLPAGAGRQVLRVRYRGTLAALDATLSHRQTLGAMTPMASPEGSFLPAGSGWYPEVAPLFGWRLTIRTPADQIAVAPGTRHKMEMRGGSRTAVFAFEQPSEGVDLLVGPYVMKERRAQAGDRAVVIRTYFHEELTPLADGYLEAAGRYVSRYSREIGPYPYSHFSIISSPLPTGFGMPSLTYLGRDVLKLPFIRDTSLGHEVLHNWWGNGVYIDTARGNWAEGLTTFMADYAYKEDLGPGAAREMRHGWLRDYAALPAEAERPLSEFRARSHTASSAIGYGKAAMLFFALRARLGPEKWSAGLRDFWQRHRFTAATFDDLAAAFERASGEDLSGFFQQWLQRTGAPLISVREARNLSATQAPKLAVTVTQHPAVYESRVPLRIFLGAGHEDVDLALIGEYATRQFTTSSRAAAVSLDPDFTVWRQLLSGEAPPILRDAQAATRARLIVLDPALQQQSAALASQFLEGEIESGSADEATSPVYRLLVGAQQPVDQWLRDRGLPARPEVARPGDTQVWIAPDPQSRLVVVSLPAGIEDARKLTEMLSRRLPHLSRYSWLTFENGKTASRGNWPVESPRIKVE